MSVSLEPVDVPETVESETNPTPTQIEESESNPTIKEIRPDEAREGNPISFTDSNTRVRSQGGENPVEAPEGNLLMLTEHDTRVKSQGDENPVKKRGHLRKEVPKEPQTPKAAPKKAVRMKPLSVNESSSEEETPLTRDDMGTLLLDYLVKRKQSQQQARRTMWSQLAGLS